jgi:hypothetical protein
MNPGQSYLVKGKNQSPGKVKPDWSLTGLMHAVRQVNAKGF